MAEVSTVQRVAGEPLADLVTFSRGGRTWVLSVRRLGGTLWRWQFRDRPEACRDFEMGDGSVLSAEILNWLDAVADYWRGQACRS